MRSRTVAVLVAVAVSATGCAAMPTRGAVHLGRAVPVAGGLADLDVRVFPPSWHSGMQPRAVVAGFLRALVNDDGDYATARSYLTPAAAAAWQPDVGLTTYDDSALRMSRTGVRIGLQAPRLGRIDRRGGYQPAPGTLTSSFTLKHSGDSWLIDRLANGVLLSSTDAQRAFRLADVYYLNRAGTAVVPDQVLLQDSQQGIATALVTSLLSGPSRWLAPGVHSALAPGTALIGNVPVHNDGVADVNLSTSIRAASTRDLVGLSAQLVWTLRQVPEVTAVRLLADGTPVTVAGEPARQPLTAWSSFDPGVPPGALGVVYTARHRLVAPDVDSAMLARSNPGSATAVARSGDGKTLAVVQRTATGARLMTGALGDPLTPRLVAASMTPPTFDAAGRVVTVVTDRLGQRAVSVDRDGRVRRLAAPPSVIGRPVTALRISRDGARVAAVVGGRLVVGSVGGSADSEALGGFRAVAPGLRDVAGLTWSGADSVVVTARAGGRTRQVWEADTAGYAVRPVDTRDLRDPVDVTAAPGQPLIVGTADGVLWIDLNGWRRLGVGGAAVYSG